MTNADKIRNMTTFTKEQIKFIVKHFDTIDSLCGRIEAQDRRNAEQEGRLYLRKESFAEECETLQAVLYEISAKEADTNDS